jgi:2-keto-3-deoxy-L-rhamnonate aldolase RhmA
VALSTRGINFGIGGHASVDTRNEQILGIIQIESAAAVEAANTISALEGVDVLFLGPADMSHALGVRGQLDHPDYVSAVERLAQAARSSNKAAGVLVWSPADMERYLPMGYTFFALSGEGQMLDRAARDALAAARGLAEQAAG